MHYKNGREAKENDPVVAKQYGKAIAGTLHSLNAAATSCNAMVATAVVGGMFQTCVSVGDCVHAEDAWEAVQPPVPKQVAS